VAQSEGTPLLNPIDGGGRAISTVAWGCFIGTIATTVFTILPGYLGELAKAQGFSDRQLNYIASAELGGMALGAMLATLFFARLGRRQVGAAGCFAAIGGNLLAFVSLGYIPLLIMRVTVGAADGICLALCYVVLGESRDPDRSFGLFVALQLLIGAILLAVLPHYVRYFGALGIFGGFAVLFGIVYVGILKVTAGGVSRRINADPGAETNFASIPIVAMISLCGLMLYFTSQAAVWANVSLIGSSFGLTDGQIALTLSVSTLAGLAGALIAAALGNRLGRVFPLASSLLLALIALCILMGRQAIVLYGAAVAAINFAFNYTTPYQLACLAAVDRSGRSLMISAIVSTLGLALGPFLAAQFLTGAGYQAVNWIGISLFTLSFLLFLPAARQRRAVRVLTS
jgi:predicted MFS family arabinose efflux permease